MSNVLLLHITAKQAYKASYALYYDFNCVYVESTKFNLDR